MTLTPDKRKRVAEDVTGDTGFISLGERVWLRDSNGVRYMWRPESDHKDALTKRVAELIEGLKEGMTYYLMLGKFNKALATGNSAELEQILWELIEVKE